MIALILAALLAHASQDGYVVDAKLEGAHLAVTLKTPRGIVEKSTVGLDNLDVRPTDFARGKHEAPIRFFHDVLDATPIVRIELFADAGRNGEVTQLYFQPRAHGIIRVPLAFLLTETPTDPPQQRNIRFGRGQALESFNEVRDRVGGDDEVEILRFRARIGTRLVILQRERTIASWGPDTPAISPPPFEAINTSSSLLAGTWCFWKPDTYARCPGDR